MFFAETWRDGRGAGLGIGAGTQRLTFKTPTKTFKWRWQGDLLWISIPEGNLAGVRDMTSHMYVWPQSMEMDEIILPQPFSVPVLDEIEPNCLNYPLCATRIEEPWWEWNGVVLRAETWGALPCEDWIVKRSGSQGATFEIGRIQEKKKVSKTRKGSNVSATCKKVKMKTRNMTFVFGNLEVVSDPGE